MRTLTGLIILFLFSSCGNNDKIQKNETNLTQSQESAKTENFEGGAPAGTDTVLIGQPNDTRIHILGFGNMFINYTETIDGYTLVLNEQGIYEYGVRGSGGDIVGSQIDARDPSDRTKSEIAFLSKIPKHLRYDGKKLNMLLARKHKWEESVKYGNQYRQYKEQQQKQQNNQNNQK